MPQFKRCRCNIPIYQSSARSWETGRCFDCRRAEDELSKQIERAERKRDALLSLKRVVDAGKFDDVAQ